MAGVEFPEEDGTVLNGLGLDLILTFNSGSRYTPVSVMPLSGAASPWNVGVKSFVDLRAANPTAGENSLTTPLYFNCDLQLRKEFVIDPLRIEFTINILNVFNRKHVLNVYPTTGSPNDDGWLLVPAADNSKSHLGYEEFYKTINLDNRWGYMSATGNDIYGMPRQIRIGLKVKI